MNFSKPIQLERMTSCGLNSGPLKGEGRYEAYIACNLMSEKGTGRYDKIYARLALRKHPYFTQKGRDRENNPNQYIANFRSGSIAGFKYFDIKAVKKISVEICGNAEGQVSVTNLLKSKEYIARIEITPCRHATKFEADINLKSGKQALYFSFQGKGNFDFFAFELTP